MRMNILVFIPSKACKLVLVIKSFCHSQKQKQILPISAKYGLIKFVCCLGCIGKIISYKNVSGVRSMHIKLTLLFINELFSQVLKLKKAGWFYYCLGLSQAHSNCFYLSNRSLFYQMNLKTLKTLFGT